MLGEGKLKGPECQAKGPGCQAKGPGHWPGAGKFQKDQAGLTLIALGRTKHPVVKTCLQTFDPSSALELNRIVSSPLCIQNDVTILGSYARILTSFSLLCFQVSLRDEGHSQAGIWGRQEGGQPRGERGDTSKGGLLHLGSRALFLMTVQERAARMPEPRLLE